MILQTPYSQKASDFSPSSVLFVLWGEILDRKDVIALPALENLQHEAFCLHYAKTGNATESYKQAGYSPKSDNSAASSARRLLQNVKVKGRLQELADEMAEDKIADIREIHEILSAIVRGETLEDVVIVEGKGNGVVRSRDTLR